MCDGWNGGLRGKWSRQQGPHRCGPAHFPMATCGSRIVLQSGSSRGVCGGEGGGKGSRQIETTVECGSVDLNTVPMQRPVRVSNTQVSSLGGEVVCGTTPRTSNFATV